MKYLWNCFLRKKLNDYFIGKLLGMKYFENYDMVCILWGRESDKWY